MGLVRIGGGKYLKGEAKEPYCFGKDGWISTDEKPSKRRNIDGE